MWRLACCVNREQVIGPSIPTTSSRFPRYPPLQISAVAMMSCLGRGLRLRSSSAFVSGVCNLEVAGLECNRVVHRDVERMETGTRCRIKDNLSGRAIRRNESKGKQRMASSGQQEGNIWSGGGIQCCSHSPPSPAASLCHPEPILHPPAAHRTGKAPWADSSFRMPKSHHPSNLDGSLAAACLPPARPVRGGEPPARCKLCMPTLPSPASRRPCGQWAAAPGRLAAGESLSWGYCTSITSPKPSRPLSNHQRWSNRRPHRVALDQPASGPLCTSHSIAPGCWAHVFPGPY